MYATHWIVTQPVGVIQVLNNHGGGDGLSASIQSKTKKASNTQNSCYSGHNRGPCLVSVIARVRKSGLRRKWPNVWL